jgi:hypothetical protein
MKIKEYSIPIIVFIIIVMLTIVNVKVDSSKEDQIMKRFETIEKRFMDELKQIDHEIQKRNVRDSLLQNRIDSLNLSLVSINQKQNTILHEKQIKDSEIIGSSDSADWVWFQRRFPKNNN